ncbi:hypothetical protein [Streptosporangium pseudovulgare]|nr:hypothetical protein [Streptosporangium pseudovulgare]
MPSTDETTAMSPITSAVRREWAAFRSRGRVIAMIAATLAVIVPGLLAAYGDRASCGAGGAEIACPTDPVGPDGRAVSDQFFFVHRPLGENGVITARVTSMTGVITYPPPDHDEIVPGLVPWAKAGIIVKDGTGQGSAYAALMVTGGHGVRMQHDYVHDTAGRPGGVSPRSPRWLRLVRSGDTVTGYESADGRRWTKVGTARLAGSPRTVEAGLFVTSPGDLTVRRTGLGGGTTETRFTQATAVFDNVSLDGATAGGWRHDGVGEMGHTDWERNHRAPGLVEADGTFTVTGSGDIGPVGTEGGHDVADTLVGLAAGLAVVIAVAARFAVAAPRTTRSVTTGSRTARSTAVAVRTARGGVPPSGGRDLAARAVVAGAAAFSAGLVAAGVTMPVGAEILRANGNAVLTVSWLTLSRVVIGVAVLFAVTAVLALALGALLRRTWAAVLGAMSAVILPYVLGASPLLPDEVARWLLRLTPAAGFAVQQTAVRYPQVIAHYVPSEGYFPLAWWAGLGVLCGHAALALALAASRWRRSAV